MDVNEIRKIVETIVDGFENDSKSDVKSECGSNCMNVSGEIPIEVSARHVHLSREDIDKLFGEGYEPKKKKDISQPGQFLCEERVNITGPKGQIRNVALLGPARNHTQVEISLTDAKSLGVKAPVSMSGVLDNAGSIHIMAGDKMIYAEKSVIVAKNHIHMTPEDARNYNVSDGQCVNVKMMTARPLTFEQVPVRVSNTSKLAMHIDFDEANAAAFNNGDKACIAGNKAMPALNFANTVMNNVPANAGAKPMKRKAREYVIEGKMITELEVRKAARNNAEVVIVQSNAILGPMAKDFLREKNIKIRYSNEEV